MVNAHVCREQNGQNGNNANGSGSDVQDLVVMYHQRHHGNGRVPGNRERRDYARQDVDEMLKGRLVDRAIRPRLEGECCVAGGGVEVCCVVQSRGDSAGEDEFHGVTGSVNGASAALLSLGVIRSPVAAVVLGMDEDGNVSAGESEGDVAKLCVGGSDGKVR